jgi:isoleucyl-tRNA synthetase
MTDYKSTLNLPNTDFPMKANLAQREPTMLAQWQSMDLYGRIRTQNLGNPKFILHDGPPYANGDLHLGHAVNKTLKDIIVKAKTLAGFDSPYVPGWDCHGLPIEHNVEKKLGKAGKKVSHAEFRKACRVYAAKQVENQKQDFIRLGVFGEWDNPYLTMDFITEANTVRALGRIAANGHLVKGFKPVYWSVVGASALAEAEVEYQDKTSFAIDVRFPVVDKEEFLRAFAISTDYATDLPLSVLIWTTTPWTLPANQAVSLNAELDYVLMDCEVPGANGVGRELLVVAAGLQESVSKVRHLSIYNYSIPLQSARCRLFSVIMSRWKQAPALCTPRLTMVLTTLMWAVNTASEH